jgi:hypothetical protein
MALVRFLPLIVPSVAFGLFELFYFYPKMFFVAQVLLALLFFFSVYLFVNKSFTGESWAILIMLPAQFTLALNSFSLLIPGTLLIQSLYVLNAVFLYFYFRSLYYYLFRPDRYRDYFFENLSSYGNFLTFYFAASTVYGLQSFVNIPVWILMIGLLLVTSLIVLQLFWSYRIKGKKRLVFIPLLCLVLAELAWSASFLTLSYYVLGLILTICYYILIGVTRFYLLDKLDGKIVKLYLFYGLLSILVVLLTARWF